MPPEMKPGMKIYISPKGMSPAIQSFTSHVEKVEGTGRLVIHTPIVRNELVTLPVGEGYLFYFHTRECIYEADGAILAHFEAGGLHYMGIEHGEYHRVQRRNFFRVDVLMDFTLFFYDDRGGGVAEPSSYKGVVKNLSGGGLFFVTAKELSANDEIICSLDLHGDRLEVKGKVLEVQPPSSVYGSYKCRARFIEIERQTQERIVRFVLDHQMERRRSQYIGTKP